LINFSIPLPVSGIMDAAQNLFALFDSIVFKKMILSGVFLPLPSPFAAKEGIFDKGEGFVRTGKGSQISLS
jgi:hypothetical protein